MIQIGVGQIVWILVLFLQFLTIVESVYFFEEYGSWKSRQDSRRRCNNSEFFSSDLEIDGCKHFEEHGFHRSDVLILDRLAPSVVRLERSFLVAVGEIGWPIIVMIVWIMEISGLDKGLPFPYEYLGVLEIIAAFPYLKMVRTVLRERMKGHGRLTVIIGVSMIWLVFTSISAYFGWTIQLRQRTAFLIAYGVFQVVNICTRLMSSAWHLSQVREMQQVGIQETLWEEMPRRWYLWSDKKELMHVVLDCVLMLFWVVDSNDYTGKSSAVVDIVASASYFLVVRGYDIWWELLCDEVLLSRRDQQSQQLDEVVCVS